MSIEGLPANEPVSEAAPTDAADALFLEAVQAASRAGKNVEQSEVTPPPAPEVPPEVETPPGTPLEAATPPVETPKPTERIAPALLKIMEREAQVVERESKLRALEAEIQSAKQQLSGIETAQKRFQYDPVSFIRQMAPDLDLGEVAQQLWYAKLGNAAPPEHRATQEARAAKGSIDELRAEFKAEQQRLVEDLQRQQAEAAYHQYVGAVNSFAKSIPEQYPLVKAFASEDAERVQRGLLKIAQQHAQATGGEVLTPQECAERLNKELSALQRVFAPSQPAAAPAPSKQEQPVKTLRNKHTSIQPNRALPDPNDEEAKLQAAIEAARAARKING